MTTRIYGFIALTGGGTGALDKYPEAGMPALATDDYALGHVSGVFYVYWFNGASAEAENPPAVIAPDSGSGRWILKGFSIAHNDLSGLDGGNASPEEFYHLSSAGYNALTDVNAQLVNLQTDGTPTFGALKITTGAGAGKILVSDADGDLSYQDLAPSGFPAEVRMYAGSSAPSGWLLCDGTSYLRADYSALFAVIGTTYGSADGTHFNVPDFRGRIPIGVGTGTGGGAAGTGLPTGGSALTAVALGTWKGEETHVLTSGENATHSHTYSGDTGNESAHTHNYSSAFVPQVAASGGGSYYAGGAATRTTAAGSEHKHSFSGTSSDSGSSTAHNNIQPVMGINFIIKT